MKNVDCYQCHKSTPFLRFDPMGTQCIDCHISDYNATLQPSHSASGYPKDCFLCHNENGWQSIKFEHNINSNFVLNGSHTTVACGGCHTTGYTGGTPTACVKCHLTNFTASLNPIHSEAKFSDDCISCHTSTSWKTTSFDHTSSTTFPLKGGHTGVTCNKLPCKGLHRNRNRLCGLSFNQL